MKRVRAFYLFLSLSSLTFGTAIYLLFRDIHNTVLFALMPKPEFLKTIAAPLKPSLFSDILRYNIPDMLWFVSAILFFRFIWFYKNTAQKSYIACFYGIGAIFEASQLSKNVPGTFDWMDLLFMGIGAFIEGLLYNVFIKRRFV